MSPSLPARNFSRGSRPTLPVIGAVTLLCAALGGCGAQDSPAPAPRPADIPEASAATVSQAGVGAEHGVGHDAEVEATIAPAPEPAAQDSLASAPGAAPGQWRYESGTAPSGASVPRAVIASRSGQETLVFEDQPVSGRDAILQLPAPAGCKLGCKVSWRVDGGQDTKVPASRLDSQPNWLSMRQPRELWKAVQGAQLLEVTYEGARGPIQVQFDVAGADAARLPGWIR